MLRPLGVQSEPVDLVLKVFKGRDMHGNFDLIVAPYRAASQPRAAPYAPCDMRYSGAPC